MQLFDTARLKLTAWYVLISLCISLFFSLALYRLQIRDLDRFQNDQLLRIERRLGLYPGYVVIDTDLVREAKNRLFVSLIVLNGVVVILSGGLGYFLAGRTLDPVQTMLNNQKRFTSDAAHELRTPLTALKTSLEVYLRNPRSTLREAKDLIRGNLVDVERLQGLTESLLTLSQVQEKNPAAGFRPVDLKHIAQTALSQTQPLAARHQVKVHADLGSVRIFGDANRLVSLAVILIENAIKYVPGKKGEVWVQVSSTPNLARLQVKDNGIGISTADQTRIFDRFFRSDAARSSLGRGGYGLGLSIAKEIASAHQGTLKVSSRTGQGAIFTFLSPRSRS